MKATNKARVLIVEDDVLSRDMLTRRLQQRGFTVDSVADGAACLVKLSIATGAPAVMPPAFDLVLLDVQMPGLSGLEVLEQIRGRYSPDALPVILVTALSETDDTVRGLEAGANDYVTKPIVLPILLARMSACLRIGESVNLLVEAERQRVVIAALGEACHQLSQPMQASIMTLESLIRSPATSPGELVEQLGDVLDWTLQVAHVIHRMQEVGTLQALPYIQRMQLLDSGRAPAQGERPR